MKDWDIRINFGIKTGYNDAFIIDGKKREELIKQDPKSEEIIRPILKGRDIKRYSYDFADLWLLALFPSKNYNIDDFPAVKKHLLTFGENILSENGYAWVAANYLEEWCYKRLEQTGKDIYINGEKINITNNEKSRKATNNKWFETQDSISYWDDFLRPKIVYPDIMRMPSQNTLLTEYPYFYLDTNGFFVEATNFILSGNDLDLLCAYLASDLGFFLFAKFYTGPQFDDTGFRYKKDYLQNLLVPSFSIFDVSELRKLYEFVAQRNDSQDQLSQYRSRIDEIFMDGIGLTPEEALYVKSFKENLIKEKNRKH